MARPVLERELTGSRAHSRGVGKVLPAEAGVSTGTPALAGSTAQNQLPTSRECAPGAHTAAVEFAVASQADDADLRLLLRENPMPGRISLSLEREPDYFADASLPGETKQTIVARNGGQVVCAGSCAIRQRFVNGAPRRVGYLGGLRLDSQHAGRFDIVRRGYAFFHELQAQAPADFYFTSIAAGNERARKFLERALPGMPRYEFMVEFVTMVLPVCRTRPREKLPSAGAWPRGASELARLNNHGRLHQFAPCWSAAELNSLEALGLREHDFHSIRSCGKANASAALWDQRNFKQTVVRGYSPALALGRPAFNVWARSVGRPPLPPIGGVVPNAFVSHLVVEADDPKGLIFLVAELRHFASQRGIELLTLGFAANDPRLATMCSHFRVREYRTRLYVVRWPDLGGAARELDGRILAPEAALL